MSWYFVIGETKRVLVSLEGDQAIAGTLRKKTRDWIELEHALVRQRDSHFQPLPDPGRVSIPTRRVELIQDLPPGTEINLSPSREGHQESVVQS